MALRVPVEIVAPLRVFQLGALAPDVVGQVDDRDALRRGRFP